MIDRLPQRLRLAAALTAPLAAVEMSRHLTDQTHHPSTTWNGIAAVLASTVVLAAGWPLLQKGWLSFRCRRLNMFSMIAPGVIITYLYSLAAFLAPGWFPDAFRLHGTVPVYFEAAAMIVTLVLLGQWLEERAERRTGDALASLARLQPGRASVLRDGIEEQVPVDDLRVGDQLVLRGGDRVPIDGVILSGVATIDESMLTGEPFGTTRAPGDHVSGGTLVVEGSAVVHAEQVGEHTTLARIIAMVRAAQASRAPIQRVADRITGKLVPVVLLLAMLTFLFWWRFGPQPAAWYGLVHAVTVLMITCPCALGLATPLSIVTGLGRGAVAGILIKDAAHLERLAAVTTVLLDKTGTLTSGRPILHACVPVETGQEGWVLKAAASVEHWSRHPLASAIVEGARTWGLAIEPALDFRSEVGQGVSGRVGDISVQVGRRNWLDVEDDRAFAAFEQIVHHYEQEGRTVLWVATDRRPAGLLVIADTLKAHAAETIHALEQRGITSVMVTGDHEHAAHNVARQLGIRSVIAGIRPEHKAEAVAARKRQGGVVAMVGDGINDAPALAAADIGIAMGTGTAVAMASGQINLLHGELLGLIRAIDLSRAVMRNIRQNLFFAFAYNAVMIPLAAGALFPWTGWMLTPMLASAAMSASSITVILNALRLRRLDLDAGISGSPR
ncbi:MAG TPA: copper-translocating P-type ATPase [Kiritimatiellia bacterium]|nr:copper-translocating P-type ATPase [Kiritimatiellia bacterium]HMP32967.1 copper-translocating P-type ATPase [Kiritimatiellia bacterium]